MINLREAIRQILTTKRSNRQIAISVRLSHTTISKYRKRLAKKNVDWETIDILNDSEIESLLKTTRNSIQNKRHPDWLYIHKLMQQRYMTRQAVWEDYRIPEPETAYGYSWFAYNYDKYKRKLDISMRQTHRAGECVFVDFAGTTVPYINRDTGEKIDTQIFVGALGCSNYTFVRALRSQSLIDWVHVHNKMFQFFGGTPEVIVPDNLKAAVTRAGKNLIVNRTYQELCSYYGPIVAPARVRRPQDKSKAEVAVLIVTRWILVKLRRMIFFSLEEINKAIEELLWQLNERNFKKLPGCRRSRFEELDKPMLRPLPVKPFEYAVWTSKQKVSPDYHIHADKHYYSVPYQLIGSHVEARVTSNIVEIFNLGKRVASHIRSHEIGGNTTNSSHLPESHRKYAEQTSENMIKWAKTIGVATVAVVTSQFKGKQNAVLGLQACGKLQRLAKQHGNERFELACKRAKLIGSLTATSVHSILQRRRIEFCEEDMPIQIDLPFHHNVRGAEYYDRGVN